MCVFYFSFVTTLSDPLEATATGLGLALRKAGQTHFGQRPLTSLGLALWIAGQTRSQRLERGSLMMKLKGKLPLELLADAGAGGCGARRYLAGERACSVAQRPAEDSYARWQRYPSVASLSRVPPLLVSHCV